MGWGLTRVVGLAGGLMVLAASAAACGDSDEVVVGGEASSWDVQRLGEGGPDAGAALAEANGVVVAATSTESGDLLTWRSADGGEMEGPTTSPGADGVAVRAVAGGPQGFVAVANDWSQSTAADPVVWRSDDGTTWEALRADDLGELAGRSEVADVVATSDGFVAVGTELLGDEEGAGSPRAWWSEDGAEWTAADLSSTDGYAASIVADGDVLHALGEHTAWRSEDGGRTWQASSITTDTFDLSFGVSGLAVVDEVLLTSSRGEVEGADAQEVLLRSPDGGRTWEEADLASSLAVPLGEAALFGGGVAPVWLLASGHVDPFSDPDLCYADPSACGGGDPIVLETTDAVAWRPVDLTAASGGRSFDVADLLQTGAGDTIVLAVDEGLATWTWPASAGELPEAEAEPPPEGSDLPVASEAVPLEEGMTYRYPKDTHCGIDELGIFNDQVWHAEGTSGEDPFTGEVEMSADWPEAGASILGYLTFVDEDTIEYSIEPDGEPIATYHPEPMSELWGCM